jgi:hypothetical protein
VIKIPQSLQDIKAGKVPGIVKPKEPLAPIKPKRRTLSLLIFICSLLAIIGVNGNDDKLLANVVLLIISLAWIMIDDKKYIKKKKKYNILLQAYKVDYDNYQTLLKEFNLYTPIINNPEKFEILKENLINDLIKTTESCIVEKRYKMGASEKFFASFLKKWFLNEVYDNLAVEDSYETYEPDFTFKSSTTNLHIDIEIDEPYILGTLTPIHYLDDNGISIDIKRDEYFVESNWLVIRFSEEQITISPDECCHVIAKIIFEITKDDKYLNKFNENEIALPYYSRIWSYESAYIFAENKLRETYLKQADISFNYKNIEVDFEKEDYFNDLPF